MSYPHTRPTCLVKRVSGLVRGMPCFRSLGLYERRLGLHVRRVLSAHATHLLLQIASQWFSLVSRGRGLVSRGIGSVRRGRGSSAKRDTPALPASASTN